MKKKYILLFILVSLMFFSKVEAYEEYKIGDKVRYDGNSYYVISNSDKNTNYVTLLKEKSLTVDEINKYGRDESGKLFVNKNVVNTNDPEKVIYYFDNIVGIAYYSGDGCKSEYFWNGSNIEFSNSISTNCVNDYNSSDIKKVVDNWAKDNFNATDLVEVDGYSSRLLNYDEINNNLGPVTNKWGQYFIEGEDWFKNFTWRNSFWSMIKNSDNSYKVANIRDSIVDYINVFEISSVKPVINLNKCLIDETERECIVDEEDDANENVCNKTITKYNEYKVCDTVEYKGDKYYVIRKSDSNQKFVTLLKT